MSGPRARASAPEASARGSASSDAPRAIGLFAWVAVAGASTMAVELSAVRLVSPWFGASSVVWTNVIGVILLALALGYLLGARWAARPRIEPTLALALGASAVFTALLPLLAKPVCGWFMPEALPLEHAGPLFGWGSLAATSVLFLLPAAALGTIGPLAVELASRRGARPGVAGGQVLCVSTLGSLVGTFSTTHLLIPELGIARTIGLAALLLGTGALAVALAGRMRGASASLLVLVTIAVGASRTPHPALPDGVELLESVESSYQSVRAVRDVRGAEEMRWLQVNEGLDSFQSVWRAEAGALGPGYYYDAFALPAWWAGRASGTWSVAVLGLGAGTTFRVLDGASPPGLDVQCRGVEIDSAVVELGRRWFQLPADGASHAVLAGWDARSALRQWSGPFDEIVLDAYAHQTEIPAHLCSREALREMRAKLAPGGWLVVNVGGFSFEDPLLRAVAATTSSAFDEERVLVMGIGGSRNYVVFARAGLSVVDPADPSTPRPPPELMHLWGPAQLGSGARWFDASMGTILTDDRNPCDVLQRRSIELAQGEHARL